ncbi:adenosine deaminase [Polymorphospora sp. NPDC050346]|uniref:adenosine deaminase n=1 Tax=Polymorphospora sp. NPDC050346 TaxID=3155780 RepID=UPI0033F36D52
MSSSLCHADLSAVVAAMPKVELHVHVEGSMRPETFLRLVRKHHLDLGVRTEAEVRELFRFRDFAHFLDLYERCTAAIREPDDISLITYELGLRAHGQNVRYLEATYSPGPRYRGRGIPYDEQLDALSRAADRVLADTGVRMRFVLDHVRGEPLDECHEVAAMCVAGARTGAVVGLGLGGFEPGRPASLFAEAIRYATANGVAFVPHAGEAVGPEGIWDCLEFGPARIGHGIRAADDPDLLAVLRDRRIPLEVCPTSNLCTGTVRDLREHPLRRLWEAGVPVTVNTDDPSMFHTDLTDEHRLAVTHFGFSVAELAEMTLAGADSALLPEPDRHDLGRRLRAELAEFRVSAH